MALKLINGLFYYEHELNLDNQELIDEIIETRNNPSNDLNDSRPHHLEVDEQHTFYEDVPLKEETFDYINYKVQEITNKIFGMKNAMDCTEIWGHIVKPGEQTMIHTHHESNSVGLSWVYYPHMPENSGNLVFICNTDQQRIMWEIKSKPNTVYLFSRDILHFTPRNSSKETRVSISGNTAASPELESIIKNDVEFKNNYWYFKGRNGENTLSNE